MSVARRVASGTLATLVGHVIKIAWHIVTVPLFLWAWGTEQYGEWITLYAVVTYLTLVDGGWTTYVTNRLTASFSAEDRASYQDVLDTALSLYIRVVSAITVVGALVLAIAPVNRLLGFHHLGQLAAASVAFFLLVQIVAGIPQGLLLGIYRTTGEFARGELIGNLEQLLLLILTVLALWLSSGPAKVAAAQLVPLAVGTAFIIADLRRRRPWIALRLTNIDWSLARSFVVPSLMFAAIQLSLAFVVQGTVLIVNARLGAAAVAVFATIRTLANMNRQVVNVLNHAAQPEFIRLRARDGRAQLRFAHRLMVKASLAATLGVALVLHFCGRDVVALWTRGRVVADQAVLDGLLAFTVAQAPWLASSSFPLAFNLHRTVAWCYVVSSVLGLGFVWALVGRFGLVGAPLGLLIADVLVCGWLVPTHVCRLLGDKPSAFWADLLLRSAVVAGLAWAMTSALAAVPSPLVRFVAVTATSGAIFAGLGFTVLLRGDERRELVRLIRTMAGGAHDELRMRDLDVAEVSARAN